MQSKIENSTIMHNNYEIIKFECGRNSLRLKENFEIFVCCRNMNTFSKTSLARYNMRVFNRGRTRVLPCDVQ